MSRIRQLDAGVINKIAAGEVVERPANVVKEMLENSIDALATRIDVHIAEGGIEAIRIVDNGEGIHADDLPLAVASHATSKIRAADDLFQVRTMGFRGEALASIAEVSRFRIRSRHADCDTGVEMHVTFGQAEAPQPCGCPQGTLVEVRQLFANTPVRRKFLKTKATEFGHISEHFTRVALANPRLHMVLRHNDKTIYELPPADQLVDRLSLFFGHELGEQLIWVESESQDVRIWGYVAHPSQSKATRKGQYFFLNGRWIQDRSLQHALTEAYRGILMVGRQPIAFLFIEMPPRLVDVNVHPMKLEVRFQDSQQLYRQLLGMIRTKFLSLELTSELRVEASQSEPDEPSQSSMRPQQFRVQFEPWTRPQQTADLNSVATPWDLPSEHEAERHSDQRRVSIANTHPDSHTEVLHGSDERSASVPHQPPGNGIPAQAPSSVRAMQIHDCYIVAETEHGLTVIDQHALHERVIYERLRPRVLSGAVESQRLLVPLTIDLGAEEAALLLTHAELLTQLGFGIESFGANTVLLNRYPAMLGKADMTQLMRDLAERLGSGAQQPTRRDLLDELLHMMSCKAAIKAGQRLTPDEIASLLAQRDLIDDAHHCPHGRPTALVLSQQELDRQFGRLG